MGIDDGGGFHHASKYFPEFSLSLLYPRIFFIIFYRDMYPQLFLTLYTRSDNVPTWLRHAHIRYG